MWVITYFCFFFRLILSLLLLQLNFWLISQSSLTATVTLNLLSVTAACLQIFKEKKNVKRELVLCVGIWMTLPDIYNCYNNNKIL